MIQDDIKTMAISLPEDVTKAKWCGDFDRALRLIDRYLASEKTPNCLKTRLKLERAVIQRLPLDYCYTQEQAVARVQADIPDFTSEELDALRDSGKIDWIYIKGETVYSRRFYETLLSVYPDIAQRAGKPAKEEGEERKLLYQNIEDMKRDGEASWSVHMRASLKISDDAFRPGEALLVHLPVPKNAMNMRDIEIIGASHPVLKLADADAPSRTIALSGKFEKNEPFWVEYKYISTVRYTALDSAAVCAEQPDFDTGELYPHIRFTPFIRALCAELSAGETNPLIRARSFYDYCTKVGTYSFMREYFALPDSIPDYYGTGLKGDCGVQALLFITLCRCAGIPAKWQSGLFVTPQSQGCHDWAQFYIAPYGWLFADPSFGGSAYRAGSEVRHDFYFGNLDPFRMVANSELQAEFDPPKSQLRIDPFDNQRGEAEYADYGVIWTQTDAEWELIEMKKLS
ncbi:MAG: transglutaminase-like domain-containing protein [Hominenteromicrobium sp.]